MNRPKQPRIEGWPRDGRQLKNRSTFRIEARRSREDDIANRLGNRFAWLIG
jgi:hypothetical protein